MADKLQVVPVANYANKNVEAQYVEMMVPLYSYGCHKKIKKALAHFRGIYSVNVDYKQQKVTVWGICNKKDILAAIRTKRREACFWNSHEDSNLALMNVEEEAAVPSSSPKFSFALAKVPPLISWKLWKKVFNRSNNTF